MALPALSPCLQICLASLGCPPLINRSSWLPLHPLNKSLSNITPLDNLSKAISPEQQAVSFVLVVTAAAPR